MTTLKESHIEEIFIEMLTEQGYEYFHGPTIAPNGENPQRESFASVLLENHCKACLKKLNPEVPESARVEAWRKIENLGSADIMGNNEKFHVFLTEGITVEYFKNGETYSERVKLLDIENPENNSFWAVNQLVIKENNTEKRPDVVLFINGFPLGVVELKSATSEKATLENAYTQIQNYKTSIPSLFHYNSFVIISDGIDARSSSLSAPFSRFLPWKGPKERQKETIPQLQMMTEEMLKKENIINLIRYNTVFETEEVKDEKTGIIKQVTIKKVAAYHQFYAVQKAVQQTLRATDKENGDQKIGVVWHTQGSGKSLSMVFYCGQLVTHPQMENPTLIVLTDRNDLDDQLFSTFGSCQSLLRQTPVQAKNRKELKDLLKVSGGGIIFTTIQKFYPEEGDEKIEALTHRKNVVVMADEAHRSQYGFEGRIEEVDGEIVTKYGNAKHMRDALPHASFVGFTGTPIEKNDKNTTYIFGSYIDVYDIAQAVKDGATVPISYESRLIKIKLDQKTANEIDSAISLISNATPEQIEKSKKTNAQVSAVVGSPQRLVDVAEDIVSHFEARQKTFEGKAMVVAMTREIAVKLYDQIISLRPSWHSEDITKGKIKVVMTSSSDDPEIFQPHHTTKQQRKDLALRVKDVHDELDIVIVQSMWLTGFDAPSLHTLYIDKKMQGANLMQAIARVNRVYKDKPGGLIVDYIGIGQDLKDAMAIYTDSGGEGKAVGDIAEIVAGIKEKIEILEQILNEVEKDYWKQYASADPKQRLQILLDISDYILSSEDIKNRFISEVIKLSKLFSMAVPHPYTEVIKEKVAFFQAVKSRVVKFTPTGMKTDKQVSMAVKQIVDDALSSDGVVDIFEAAGVATPSIGILSEEFLVEVQNMQHKNLAFELLKKLLSDDIAIRKTKNIAQSQKFSEMLSGVIKKYHNNQIDTAQVLQELVEIANEMKTSDNKADVLGLSSEEYAFYSVLSENKSTEFLKDDVMKTVIRLITETVRKNATVDWEHKENVRAKLRLAVKKILVKYGYPPDIARIEADKVLEQSELMAQNFTSS